MLFCGHSFCENCIEDMFKEDSLSLQCPICMVTHKFENKEAVKNIVKNFTVLSLLSSVEQPAQRKTQAEIIVKKQEEEKKVDVKVEQAESSKKKEEEEIKEDWLFKENAKRN